MIQWIVNMNPVIRILLTPIALAGLGTMSYIVLWCLGRALYAVRGIYRLCKADNRHDLYDMRWMDYLKWRSMGYGKNT